MGWGNTITVEIEDWKKSKESGRIAERERADKC